MKYSPGEKLFDWINIILLALLTLLFLLPFLSVVSTSLISGKEYALRGLFILYPQKPVITAYELLLGQGSLVWTSLAVSVGRVTIGTGTQSAPHLPSGVRPFQAQSLWPRPHHDVYFFHHAL